MRAEAVSKSSEAPSATRVVLRSGFGCVAASRGLLGIAVLALLPSGCGGVREAVVFHGQSLPPRVLPRDVGERASLPSGYEATGDVTVECTSKQHTTRIHGEWLSDVDCSEQRLTRALRERAAERGAELLIGLDCHSHRKSLTSAGEERINVCRAGLARSERPLEPSSPAPIDRELRVADAWRIRVDFWPASDTMLRRAARPADFVREVAALPVSDLPIGQVCTRCAKGCSRESVREAVLVAAGRVGANDVVDVHCIQHETELACTGAAAVYEVDPATNPAAR